MIFIDTSAIFAILNEEDPNYEAASDMLRRFIGTGRFITHNYVIVETVALIQRRLGMPIVRAFLDRLLPLVEVSWVDEALHGRAARELVGRRRRGQSFVDLVSFSLMRELGIRTAFAFDADFRREGFGLLV